MIRWFDESGGCVHRAHPADRAVRLGSPLFLSRRPLQGHRIWKLKTDENRDVMESVDQEVDGMRWQQLHMRNVYLVAARVGKDASSSGPLLISFAARKVNDVQ